MAIGGSGPHMGDGGGDSSCTWCVDACGVTVSGVWLSHMSPVSGGVSCFATHSASPECHSEVSVCRVTVQEWSSPWTSVAEWPDLYRRPIITQGMTRSPVLAAVGSGICWLQPVPSLCAMTDPTGPALSCRGNDEG